MSGQDNSEELRNAIRELQKTRDDLLRDRNTGREIIAGINRRLYQLTAELAEGLRPRSPGSEEEILGQPAPPPDHIFAIAPPQAVAFDSHLLSPEIILVARTPQGLSTTYWNDRVTGNTGGGWTYWMDHVNTIGIPTDSWTPEMPLVSWKDPQSGYFRVNGFIAVPNGTDQQVLATPYWMMPFGGFQLDTHDVPDVTGFFKIFFPATAAIWYDGPPGDPVGRINVFGIAVKPRTEDEPAKWLLREFFWDGTRWNWNDHLPPDDDNYFIRTNSGSFIFPENNGYHQAFLFVITDDGGLDAANLWLYHWTPNRNWQWYDLGRPDDVAPIHSPVAVSFVNPGTGRTEVSVFISARNRTEDRWELYERHWDGQDIDDWSDWQNYGGPPTVLLAERSEHNGDRPPGGNRFSMTCSVVWHLAGTLRINLFGYNRPYENTAGITLPDRNPLFEGGQLLEFYWDGGTWRWGSLESNEAFCPERQDISGGPASMPIEISSAVVTNRDSRVHISVFGLSQTGAVWERFWDSQTTPTWTWFRH